jgi:autotransporter-associated beta strand protein
MWPTFRPARRNLNNWNQTVAALTGAGTLDNVAAGAGATLTFGAMNAGGTFSGLIQNTGSALSLTKIGTGTQTISGANTFSGATFINAGVLSITNAATLGNTSGVTVVATGAALNLTPTASTPGRSP